MNQKLLLSVAIFFTVFLLWDKWQITQTVDTNGNVVHKSEITSDAPAQNIDIPTINTQGLEIDVSIPSVAQKGGFTTVTTDFLTVEISHKGGTIQNAFLNTYPVELEGDEKFQLLNDETGALFQAQSGLRIIDQPQLPTTSLIL
jgi:YidC/Oxa1 family membrane protein insertase